MSKKWFSNLQLFKKIIAKILPLQTASDHVGFLKSWRHEIHSPNSTMEPENDWVSKKNKSTIFQGSIFSSSIYIYMIIIWYKTLGSYPSQLLHGFFLAPIACDMVAPSTVKTIEPLSKAAKVSVFFFSSGRSPRISLVDGLNVSPVFEKTRFLGRFIRLQPQFCLAIV